MATSRAGRRSCLTSVRGKRKSASGVSSLAYLHAHMPLATTRVFDTGIDVLKGSYAPLSRIYEILASWQKHAMNTQPADGQARRRGPRSPAFVHRSGRRLGSGKTELLIQRYLTLLDTVEQPEQIVAITFTRKAAAEMRARIVRALREAAAGQVPKEPHRALTQELAGAVLERDRTRGWSLLATPRRMRIDTLDALNAWLAQQTAHSRRRRCGRAHRRGCKCSVRSCSPAHDRRTCQWRAAR